MAAPKFPLIMGDGSQVRTLEELREHADLYTLEARYQDGALQRWLKAWDFQEKAANLEELNSEAKDFHQALCAALGVTWTEQLEAAYQETVAKKAAEEAAKKAAEEAAQKAVDEAREDGVVKPATESSVKKGKAYTPTQERFLKASGLWDLEQSIDAECLKLVAAAGGNPVEYAMEVAAKCKLPEGSLMAKVADSGRAKI